MNRSNAWRPPPWYAKPVGRINFLRELSDLEGVSLAKMKEHPGGFGVSFFLTPTGVPRRFVRIAFEAHVPYVHVDGPTDSPHRYSDNSLCMWYPDDPREQRWMPADGAGVLVANIAAHLIKEQWWRTVGDWVGPEVRHSARDTVNDPKRRAA